jgi:hypothetical protein
VLCPSALTPMLGGTSELGEDGGRRGHTSEGRTDSNGGEDRGRQSLHGRIEGGGILAAHLCLFLRERMCGLR